MSINLIIILLTGANLVLCWRLHVSRMHPFAVESIVWDREGTLNLKMPNGSEQSGRLTPRALILPWLVVIYYKSGRFRTHSLPITGDMLDDECFRRLRVRLGIVMDTADA